MARFRVTTTIEAVRVVEAENPFAAAVLVGGNVTDVRPARGRLAGSSSTPTSAKKAKQTAKKRKPLSPEARAKLAQNLVKARAARAKQAKAAKKVARKPATKKAMGTAKKG
jgi:hypothetical protein